MRQTASLGNNHDEIVGNLTTLHERLVVITKSESYGQYYLKTARIATSTVMKRTSSPNANSKITLATTKFGGKDPGRRLRRFLRRPGSQDVDYEIHMQGIDPTSQDARSMHLSQVGHRRENPTTASAEIEPRHESGR